VIAAVTTSDLAQPGTVLVFVFNSPEGGTIFVSGTVGETSTTACGGQTSNAVSFTVRPWLSTGGRSLRVTCHKADAGVGLFGKRPRGLLITLLREQPFAARFRWG